MCIEPPEDMDKLFIGRSNFLSQTDKQTKIMKKNREREREEWKGWLAVLSEV